MLLSHIRLFEDEALRFHHVALKEEASLNLVNSIMITRFRSHKGASTHGLYNSLDQHPRFIQLIK